MLTVIDAHNTKENIMADLIALRDKIIQGKLTSDGTKKEIA